MIRLGPGGAARPSGLVLAVAVLMAGLGACRTGENYTAPAGPRYAGGPTPSATCAPHAPDARTPTTLRIVTFNVEFAERIDSALAVLAAEPPLRCPDILLLQEMDEAGTARIARALGMRYAYYPALHHLGTGRDFGNAVLSRWPIVADEKLVLPHRARVTGTQRTATAVTLEVGEVTVRVYSTHLATQIELGPGARKEQLQAILDDAAPHARVILGGDMNSGGVGDVARDAGFQWPTEGGPWTAALGRWDHIFLKGLDVAETAGPDATGTVRDVRGASDHRPVWVVVRVTGRTLPR